jgi:hypothetical protein
MSETKEDITIGRASATMPLRRTSSMGADDQKETPSCGVYTVTRCITRLITQMLPHYFIITTDESELLYSGEPEYANCFIEDSTNILEIQSKLQTESKCIINKRYNHMSIYYFTLYTILKKYGCPIVPLFVMKDFCDSIPLFYTTDTPHEIIISSEIDDNALHIITEFVNFIKKNNIKISGGGNFFENVQNETNNWISNFPRHAKQALDNNMYIGLSFSFDNIQSLGLSNKYFNAKGVQPTRKKCIYPVQRHSLTITDWEPGYVTLLNTWGITWGNEGFIKVPSKYYYKFVLNQACIPQRILNVIDKANLFTYIYYFKVTNWTPLPPEVSEVPSESVTECTETSCEIHGGKKRKSRKKTKKKTKKKSKSRRLK